MKKLQLVKSSACIVLLSTCLNLSFAQGGAKLITSQTAPVHAMASKTTDNKVIATRKTAYGDITLQSSANDGPVGLYFNNKLVSLKQANATDEYGYTVSFVKDYKLQGKQVFLVKTDPGGNALPVKYALVQAMAKDEIKTTPLFNLYKNGVKKHHNELSVKIANYLPYASKHDFAIYSYKSDGEFKQVKAQKDDSYYKAKYAKYSAKKIMHIAKQDKCLNDDGTINTSHACSWGIKYCFMYKSMTNPKHDKAYSQLESSFANGDCMAQVNNYK